MEEVGLFLIFLVFYIASWSAGKGGLGPEFPMFWDVIRGNPTTFLDIDMSVHDNIRCGDFDFG